MSRTAITRTDALTNDGVTINLSDCAGATGTDGHSLASSGKDDKLVFVVKNTGSATGMLTVYASDSMNSKGIGNLVVPVGVNAERTVGPVEGARFVNADGSVYLGTGFTGTIGAVELK
jgi:hypothetical protein